MSEPISLYRKFTGTAGVMIISRCLAVVSGIIYARYLGPEQFGLYSFVLSIIAMLTLPVIAGLPNLLIREVASFHLEKKWGLLKGVINWALIYVFICSIIIVFSAFFIVKVGEEGDLSFSNLLLGATLLIPLKALLSLESAILNGLRKPILAQLPMKILLPIFKLLMLSIYIMWDKEVNASDILNISIYSSICAFLIVLMFFKRLFKIFFNRRPALYKAKEWRASLIPFTLIAFVGTLNSEIASVILGFLNGPISVGYFKVAAQGVALIALGFSSVNAVIMPNIAMLHKKGDVQAIQSLLTKSVRLSVFVSLPIILILTLCGKPIILLFFGVEYLSAYPILVILCIGKLFNVLTGAVGLVLNMTGNEKSVLKILLFTLMLNIVLLFCLVPIYGGVGAALAVSISLILWNVLMAFEVWKLTKLKTWFF